MITSSVHIKGHEHSYVRAFLSKKPATKIKNILEYQFIHNLNYFTTKFFGGC